MFSIGDKIVYPMHGAGIIEAIEEKIVLGETRRYYILKLPVGDMKIMIPCDATENIGVRGVISNAQFGYVEQALRDESTDMPDNWNRRYRDNMEKLKTGEMVQVCEVVRNLMRIDQTKRLSTGEKKMLSNARQILMSELILACEKDEREIAKFIDRLVLGDEGADI